MSTKFILLWLEAPLQSWGYDSKFGRRDTLNFPTKSGILGLVCCAMGARGEQTKLLKKFAPLSQTVISYAKAKQKKNNSIDIIPKEPNLHDFQMIGSGYNDKDLWEKLLIPKKADETGHGTKITHRYYLQDAVFAVILETPSDLIESIAESLQNPVYDIYLGRKCCVPTDFVFQGIFDTKEDAEKRAGEKAKEKTTDSLLLVEDFRVIDGDNLDGDAFTLNDVPVQFGTIKKYRDRRVTLLR